MATSPNYSWPEPDNTDLVKNGALAIRTMGNAIDTTMATMTPKSTYTAKGSIAAATGASTPANLSVGNNGETLVADSSTSTGLRYQANFAAGKNAIINGAFNVWQRGTSFSFTSVGWNYTADRFASYCYGGTNTVSQQTFTPGTAPVAGYEGQYFLRVNSTLTAFSIRQLIENVQTFAGQTVTVSFWAKSASAQTLSLVEFQQNFGSGGSASVYTGGTAPSITTSWARYSVTIAIPSISGKTIGTSSYLGIEIKGAASNNFDIWGLQIEAGSVATAFQTATGTLQGELAACQRYYTRFLADNGYTYFATGSAQNTGSLFVSTLMPVPLRTAPSSIDLPALSNFFAEQSGSISISSLTSITLGTASRFMLMLQVDKTASFVAGSFYRLLAFNSTAAYIGVNAEL